MEAIRAPLFNVGGGQGTLASPARAHLSRRRAADAGLLRRATAAPSVAAPQERIGSDDGSSTSGRSKPAFTRPPHITYT